MKRREFVKSALATTALPMSAAQGAIQTGPFVDKWVLREQWQYGMECVCYCAEPFYQKRLKDGTMWPSEHIHEIGKGIMTFDTKMDALLSGWRFYFNKHRLYNPNSIAGEEDGSPIPHEDMPRVTRGIDGKHIETEFRITSYYKKGTIRTTDDQVECKYYMNFNRPDGGDEYIDLYIPEKVRIPLSVHEYSQQKCQEYKSKYGAFWFEWE